MNKKENTQIKPHKYYGMRFSSGMDNLITQTAPKLILLVSIIIYFFIITIVMINIYNLEAGSLQNILNTISKFVFPAMGIIGFVMLIITFGVPNASTIYENFVKGELTNSVNEPPILLSKRKYKGTSAIEYTFYFNGVVKKVFEEKKDVLASSLNMEVVDIDYKLRGKHKKINKQQIVVTCVPSDGIPEKIYWNDKYLHPDRDIITLGVNWLGAVTVDLKKTPHMLIGGSSGCGKTVLCRSLIHQFVEHGDKVDFFEEEEAGYEVITDETIFKNLIIDVLDTLDTRKEIFRQAHVRNLSQYNKKNPSNQLPRVVLFIDEAAEVLDATGLPKEQKLEIAEVTGLLSKAARKYRALGLTLCICTQRPSNDIISGQIKNNLDLRIAGKCDDVLSDIILDTTEASRQIPKNSVGLFFSNTNGLFRGLLLDEDVNEVNSHKKGNSHMGKIKSHA